MIKFDIRFDKIIKEIKKAEKERNKRKLAFELARIETLAKHFNNQVMLDFVENYKKNLKLLKEL